MKFVVLEGVDMLFQVLVAFESLKIFKGVRNHFLSTGLDETFSEGHFCSIEAELIQIAKLIFVFKSVGRQCGNASLAILRFPMGDHEAICKLDIDFLSVSGSVFEGLVGPFLRVGEVEVGVVAS